jgi:hypothetical protein
MQITRIEAIPLTTPYGTPGAQTRERSAVFVEVGAPDAQRALFRIRHAPFVHFPNGLTPESGTH